MRNPTPAQLPEPGAWIVTADGSQYEVVDADTEGCRYLAVDEGGERLWTPWADVDSVWADPAEAAARSDVLDTMTEPAKPPRRRVDRVLLTIAHDLDAPPSAAMMTTFTQLLARFVAGAGIVADVSAVLNPDDPPCSECGDPWDAHGWHHDLTHTYSEEA